MVRPCSPCAQRAAPYNAPSVSAGSRPISLDNATRKQYRQIAHHLKAVVMIGDAGVSEAVVAEANRALDDHELIKVKIDAGDRDHRQALGDALIEACGAEAVQRIGKVLVLYRENPQSRPALSNIARGASGHSRSG